MSLNVTAMYRLIIAVQYLECCNAKSIVEISKRSLRNDWRSRLQVEFYESL